MPRYKIGDKWIRTDKNLTDEEIDEIALSEGLATPAPTKAPWLQAELASKAAGTGTTVAPPPSMTSEFFRHAGEKISEMPAGIGEVAGSLAKAPIDFMSTVAKETPGGLIGTAYPPTMAVGVLKTLGKGAAAGASAFAENAETRTQAALDQLNLLKAKNEERIAKGEPTAFFGEPEAAESMAQSLHTVVPEVETEEAVPGSGGSLTPTGKALGKKAAETVLAAPPVRAIAGAIGGGGKAVKALKELPSRTIDVVAERLNRGAGIAEGAAAREAFALAPPPSRVPVPEGFQGPPKRLNLPEQGRIVGETELQNLNLRKKVFGDAFKKIDDLVPEGVDLTPMMDEAGNLRVPPGTELPPELTALTKKIRTEASRLERARASAKPGEVITSEALDKLVAQMQNVPFSAVHKIRSSILGGMREVKLRGSNAADIVPLAKSLDEVDMVMDQAALANPGASEAYAAARKLWKQEVVEPHYLGAGSDISKMMGDAGKTVPTPEQIGTIVPEFGADTVISARRALVPGDWAPAAAKAAGQKAFDHLVDQTIRTKLGAKGAADTIDLSTAFDDIQTKIGDAAWQQMIAGSSPEQATRLINMEKAARAYKQIQPVAPHPTTALASSAGGAAVGATGGGLGVAGGAYAGWRIAQTVPRVKADVLRWALEHPARTEMLTQGMAGATSPTETMAFAARNIAAVTRLYELDRGRPPSRDSIRISAIP